MRHPFPLLLALPLMLAAPRLAAAAPAPASASAPTAASAAAAPTAVQPFGGHHDNSQPIHIVADKLEVQQDNQVAIFTGHVDAVQGEVRLRSDVLKIFYRQNNPPGGASGAAGTAKNPAAPAAKPKPVAKPASATDPATGTKPGAAPGAEPLSGGAITRIEADGHVFVSQPGETAQGDHGVYDVDTRIITLTGTSVVLTREKDVLHGQKAVMNLNTGVSTLVPGTAGGRVQGLFIPEQKNSPAGTAPGDAATSKSGAAAKPAAKPVQ